MRKLIAACILLWALHLSAGTTTLTGIIRDEQGNPLNGTLVMRLPVPAQDPNTNTAIAPTPVTFQLINGLVVGGAPLYDLATIQPNKLWYAARGYDTAGRLAYYGNFYVTGATFNIGTATPTTVTTSNIIFANPFITNANNTVTGNNTFSGTNTFTGSNTFSGTNTFSNANTFSGTDTFTKSIVAAALNGYVYVDGTTYTTVQNAINALPLAGGTVIIPCGTYAGPTTVPSGVHLVAQCPLPSGLESILDTASALNVVRFTYTGNQTFSNTRDIAFDGIVFDFAGTGGLILDGIGWSHFDMAVVNCASSAPCLTLQSTTINVSANEFTRLYTYGGNESLKLAGNAAATHFVTDNHFGTLFLASPNNGSGTGTYIDFARWCDSNVFDYVNFFNVNVGASSIITGVIFNSDAPTVERGVYNETFRRIDLNSGAITVASSTFFIVNQAHGLEANVGVSAPLIDANGSPKTTLSATCQATPNCDFTLISRGNGDNNRSISHKDYKYLNLGAIGPTAASVGAQSNLTGTWTTPWNDTNYVVVCTGVGAQAGIPVLAVTATTTTNITVTITAASAVAASFAGVNCLGQHFQTPAY